MEDKYEIKGIERIIEKIGKQQLAQYYKVEEDSDFKSLITESLKAFGVLNGLEVATYEGIDFEEMSKKGGTSRYTQELYEMYAKEGRALIGMNFPLTRNDYTDLFFFIDDPIKEDKLAQMPINYNIGGNYIWGYVMRKEIL